MVNRTTRHIGLTAHGSELIAVVRQSLDRLDDAISRIGKVAEASMSRSVGAPPLIAANVLPEAIKEFRGFRPDVRMQVCDVGGYALTQMVEAGTLDVSPGAFFKPASGIPTNFIQFIHATPLLPTSIAYVIVD